MNLNLFKAIYIKIQNKQSNYFKWSCMITASYKRSYAHVSSFSNQTLVSILIIQLIK